MSRRAAASWSRTRSPSFLHLEQQPMKFRIVKGQKSACEHCRLDPKRPCPRFHAFGGYAAKAILHLRNERVVFEAQLLRELELRQSRAAPQLLEPGTGAPAQLLGLRRRLHELHPSPQRPRPLLALAFQSY